MAYVTVPKDLTHVKSKVVFGLTKRQLICFGGALLVGVPLYFLTRDYLSTSAAALLKLKDLSAPNSPNKTHYMVEISPHFDALASTKDNDRLFAMLPYKSLCFTGIKDRHGVYAMIGKDECRDVSIRRPRPSVRKQLTDSKQAASPKKAAARTKKKELEV